MNTPSIGRTVLRMFLMLTAALTVLLSGSSTGPANQPEQSGPVTAPVPTAPAVEIVGAKSYSLPAPALLPDDSAALSAQASVRPPRWRALQWALTQRGKSYCWGGTGPSCYDCSGLVVVAYEHAGVRWFGRSTTDMLASGRLHQESARTARPGDLVFWGDYHVELLLKAGWTIGAHHGGTVVSVRLIWGSPTYWRVAGAG